MAVSVSKFLNLQTGLAVVHFSDSRWNVGGGGGVEVSL